MMAAAWTVWYAVRMAAFMPSSITDQTIRASLRMASMVWRMVSPLGKSNRGDDGGEDQRPVSDDDGADQAVA